MQTHTGELLIELAKNNIC